MILDYSGVENHLFECQCLVGVFRFDVPCNKSEKDKRIELWASLQLDD